MHEGKVCMWDAQEFECIESAPGDPEHICASLSDPVSCLAKTPLCFWQMTKLRCVQMSDSGLDFPLLPPIAIGSLINNIPTNQSITIDVPAMAVGTNSAAASPSPAAPIAPVTPAAPIRPMIPLGGDCDLFITPSMCNGKFHEGKQCMWDFQERICKASAIGDPEHICASIPSPPSCMSNPGCAWNGMFCVQMSDFEPAFPLLPVPGAPHPHPKPTTNHRHKTPAPVPQLSNNGMLGPIIRDPEHVCDQFLDVSSCNNEPACGFDISEARCVQISDLETPPLPFMPVPGLLRSTLCSKHYSVTECVGDEFCGWDQVESRCLKQASVVSSTRSMATSDTSEPASKPPSALLLFAVAFLSTSLGIFAYHTLSTAREKKQQSRSVDDVYHEVGLDTLDA